MKTKGVGIQTVNLFIYSLASPFLRNVFNVITEVGNKMNANPRRGWLGNLVESIFFFFFFARKGFALGKISLPLFCDLMLETRSREKRIAFA